jgi:hypothetical protein
MSYSVLNVDELEAWHGVVHFTRRALGVQAFGINWPVAGPDGLTFVVVGAPPGGYEPRGELF